MLIKVTAKHLREGRATINTDDKCPLALAFKSAGLPTRIMWDGVVSFRFTIPPYVMDKIRKVQAGKRVKPFSFELK